MNGNHSEPMGIPEEIEDKLDSDNSWVVQHEDIVRIMGETRKEKPWSRYMIQQHLDGSPAKKLSKTVSMSW
jgi:hypothetical protein